jgi:hypothetical protein
VDKIATDGTETTCDSETATNENDNRILARSSESQLNINPLALEMDI